MLTKLITKNLAAIAFFALSQSIVPSAFALSAEHVVIAKNPDTALNQLAAPSVFVFPPYIQTTGQAVEQVLKATKFSLSKNLPHDIKLKLNRSLPMHLRHIGPASVYASIKALTGAQIFVVTPSTHTLSFSYDSDLSEQDLKIHTQTSGLEQYLNRTNFTLRVTEPLILDGLTPSSTQAQVAQYANHHGVFFGVNDKAEVVSVAQSKREADALAKDPRAVFFAIKGQTFRQTISRWAKANHLHVAFLVNKDLNVLQDAAFFGALDASNGALDQLLTLANGIGLNARAVFASNQTLVIKPNHFSSVFLNGAMQ